MKGKFVGLIDLRRELIFKFPVETIHSIVSTFGPYAPHVIYMLRRAPFQGKLFAPFLILTEQTVVLRVYPVEDTCYTRLSEEVIIKARKERLGEQMKGDEVWSKD